MSVNSVLYHNALFISIGTFDLTSPNYMAIQFAFIMGVCVLESLRFFEMLIGKGVWGVRAIKIIHGDFEFGYKKSSKSLLGRCAKSCTGP